MRRRSLYTTSFLPLLILAPAALSAATSGYLVHNLVADVSGVADFTDPNLVNPWGISISSASPFWLCDAATGLSTVYSFSATAFAVSSTKAAIPPSASGHDTTCTGIVANATTTAFLVGTATPAHASFIFSTEGGTISGWASAVSPTQAQMAIDNSSLGAAYYGLALYTPSSAAPSGSAPMLYAPNFYSGKIEVYDATWKSVTTLGANAFADPSVPAGYAPYNIQYLGGTAAVEGKLYVTYAKQDSTQKVAVPGAGSGYVAVFDVKGNLLQHLISGGNLNEPWGLAIATIFPNAAGVTVPNLQFGQFSGDLLVGNFGDGTISAYSTQTGALMGQLQTPAGNPVQISGLWGLQFGNGGSGGDVNALYFTAGTGGQKHGLFGSIQANPVVATSGVQNDGSFTTAIAPNTWVAILGANLAATARVWKTADFNGSSMPTALDGVSVSINGEPAYVEFVSPKQVNVLTPADLAVGSNINVVVTNNGMTNTATPVTTQALAPAFFVTGAKYVVAQHGNYAYLGPVSLGSGYTPASNGETVILYATGFGSTTPAVVNGQVVSGSPVLPTLPTITVGGVAAKVVYGGLVSLSAGLYFFDVTLPTGLTAGDQPISASLGGQTTQTGLFITIGQ